MPLSLIITQWNEFKHPRAQPSSSTRTFSCQNLRKHSQARADQDTKHKKYRAQATSVSRYTKYATYISELCQAQAHQKTRSMRASLFMLPPVFPEQLNKSSHPSPIQAVSITALIASRTVSTTLRTSPAGMSLIASTKTSPSKFPVRCTSPHPALQIPGSIRASSPDMYLCISKPPLAVVAPASMSYSPVPALGVADGQRADSSRVKGEVAKRDGAMPRHH